MTTSHRFLTGAALAVALGVGATACATQDRFYRSPAATRPDASAYDRGYREGVSEGEKDARHHRSADYDRHGEFRDADAGYHGRYGDREEYRRAFRAGFVRGYNESYGRYRDRSRWEDRR